MKKNLFYVSLLACNIFRVKDNSIKYIKIYCVVPENIHTPPPPQKTICLVTPPQPPQIFFLQSNIETQHTPPPGIFQASKF